jgi:hypothetical protein
MRILQYKNIRISSIPSNKSWLIFLVRECVETNVECCHQVDNNNTSATVLGIFFKSVTNFIIPVRVSSDKSKIFENVSVADFMLSNINVYVDSVLTLHSWISLYLVLS